MLTVRHGAVSDIRQNMASFGSALHINSKVRMHWLDGDEVKSLPRLFETDFRRLSYVNAFAATRDGW